MKDLDTSQVPEFPEITLEIPPVIDGDWTGITLSPSPCIIPQEIKLEIDRELLPGRIEICLPIVPEPPKRKRKKKHKR